MFPRNDTIHVYRKLDNDLYEGELIERKIDIEPASAAYLQFELDSAQSGSLYIYGSTSETLTFSSIQSVESVNTYTSVEGMTPTSISGRVTIKAVNKTGEPIITTERVNSYKGMFEGKTTGQYFKLYGMDTRFRGIVYLPFDADIIPHDLIKIDKVDMDGFYEVEEVYEPKCFGRTTHKEVILIYNQ